MTARVLAVVIFVVMFLLIISEKMERHYVSLGCGALTLIVVLGFCMHSGTEIMKVLNVKSVFTTGFWYQTGASTDSSVGINWSTIIFIAGMMIMVEGMALAGFFRWLCMRIAKLVHYKIIPLFMTFMIMAALLAMFIDSITVILFLAAVTVELSQLLRFDPVPMILTEIFCANLGGAATMCGDPPNIIIGTSLGYSFSQFITNTGVMAAISLVAVSIYFYFRFRKEIVSSEQSQDGPVVYPEPREAIKDWKKFCISCVIFAIAIVLLVTHEQTGMKVSFIGALVAGITLIVSGKEAVGILKKIDYKTLLFFIGLFVVVGGLEETGFLEIIASFIAHISGGNTKLMVIIIVWISAFASAFVDNIPFAATMIPVIKSLAISQNASLAVLAWALSIGTDIGGSATPIGASANVVGMSIAAKEGHFIGWGKYCKDLVPATIIVLVVSTVCIFIRYF